MPRDMDQSNSVNLGNQLIDDHENLQQQPVESMAIQVPTIKGPIEGESPTRHILLSAYKSGGKVIIYADGCNLDVLDGYEVKNTAYEYRLVIGMAGCGIEAIGGVYPLPSNANPAPLLLPEPGKRVFRKEFRLNPGL